MKKLLLTVVLGLCTLAGFSQAKFDVHAGMSMANITNSDADLKIGYSVGVEWTMPLLICGPSRPV